MANNFFVISKGVSYASLASAPSNPGNGDTYYDSTLNKFRKYENGAWADWTGTGGGLASIDPGSVITANYTVLTTDNGRVLNVDTSSSSISIQLPTPTASFKLTIKDYKGNSANNPITINRAGSELISNTASDDEIKENFRAYSLVSDGTDWYRVASFTGVAPNIAARGLFMGGSNSSNVNQNVIDYISITSTGNATDFGDLTLARWMGGACASSTRGVLGGGGVDGSNQNNTIDYVDISTIANATDFGDLTVARFGVAGASNSTRGLFMCGTGGGANNEIDYITIATTGNATDFGDLTESAVFYTAACASPTRAVRGGSPNGSLNTIDYVTIATTGNATNFGTLSQGRYGLTGCSNSTRGVFSGGYNNSSVQNTIDYITIASTGNATDFGDLTTTRYFPGACASSTRGVVAGGGSTTAIGSAQNSIDYFEISTLANAVNFGNLSVTRSYLSGCSNAHGGL